jgi:hypothetical protein
MKVTLLVYLAPPIAVIFAGIVKVAQAVPNIDGPGLTTLGVGGVLAGFMFWWYRQDRKASEERYEKLVNKQDATAAKQADAMVETAKAITGLKETIETLDTFTKIGSILERDKAGR